MSDSVNVSLRYDFFLFLNITITMMVIVSTTGIVIPRAIYIVLELLPGGFVLSGEEDDDDEILCVGVGNTHESSDFFVTFIPRNVSELYLLDVITVGLKSSFTITSSTFVPQ